jgi:hypothetical protein
MKGSVPSFLNNNDPSTNVGVGVPMLKADTVEAAKAVDDNIYLTDRLGLRTHSTQAVFENQYSNPDLFTYGPRKFQVFRLDNEEDREKYSKLLERTKLPSPKIEVYTIDRQFYRGVFYVYTEYADILYQLPTKK